MICSDRSIRSTMQNVQRWLRMHHTPGAGNWITVITERSIWTHFDGLRTKLLLDFLWLFDTSFQKNVKSHVFLKSEKKHKIRILEHWMGPVPSEGDDLLAILSSPHYVTLPNVSSGMSVITEIRQKRIYPHIPPFKVTGRTLCRSATDDFLLVKSSPQ